MHMEPIFTVVDETVIRRDKIIRRGMTEQVILQSTLNVWQRRRRPTPWAGGLWRLTRYKSRLIGCASERDFQSSQADRQSWVGERLTATATGEELPPVKSSRLVGATITVMSWAILSIVRKFTSVQLTNKALSPKAAWLSWAAPWLQMLIAFPFSFLWCFRLRALSLQNPSLQFIVHVYYYTAARFSGGNRATGEQTNSRSVNSRTFRFAKLFT